MKKTDFGIRAFKGRTGAIYTVIRHPDGAFEVLEPTNPLVAARRAGATGKRAAADKLWAELWDGESSSPPTAVKKSANGRRKKKVAVKSANGRRKKKAAKKGMGRWPMKKTAAKKSTNGRRKKKVAVKKTAVKATAGIRFRRDGKPTISSLVRAAFGGGRGITDTTKMIAHLEKRGVSFSRASLYSLMTELRKGYGIPTPSRSKKRF